MGAPAAPPVRVGPLELRATATGDADALWPLMSDPAHRIATAHQGRGYARLLLGAALRAARDADRGLDEAVYPSVRSEPGP